MALQTTATTNLATAYQKVFSTKLLDHAKQLLVLDQFATKTPFPKNAGAKTIRFFRADVGAKGNVSALTEGVPISTFRETAWTTIDCTLAQFGEAAKVSDILNMTDLLSTLKQNIESMGEDAALHADYTMMQELLDTTNSAGPIATANNRYAQGITSFNNLVAAASASAGAVVVSDLLGALTRLKITRAPKINGEYVCVSPPQVTFDWQNDSKFVQAGVYGTSKGLMNGEVGKFYGVRVVETTAPWIEATSNGAIGTYSGAGGIYTSVVLGKGAFGTPEMSGQSQFSPKVIINDKPDKSDPLNQFITAGWKAYWGVRVLNDTWAVALRSQSTYA